MKKLSERLAEGWSVRPSHHIHALAFLAPPIWNEQVSEQSLPNDLGIRVTDLARI
jgi:hypothetical protein